MTEFDLLIPGRFQTMSQGERVTYVRDIADSNELSDVFITELEREEGDELGTTVVMVADEGETRIDEQGNRLLILRSGKRYRMKPGCVRASGDRIRDLWPGASKRSLKARPNRGKTAGNLGFAQGRIECRRRRTTVAFVTSIDGADPGVFGGAAC